MGLRCGPRCSLTRRKSTCQNQEKYCVKENQKFKKIKIYAGSSARRHGGKHLECRQARERLGHREAPFVVEGVVLKVELGERRQAGKGGSDDKTALIAQARVAANMQVKTRLKRLK